MTTPIFWTNVGVDVQTALVAAQTITGISKATTGVVTYSGSDVIVNGDYIVITATGMTQVNDRVFRAANVNSGANTFDLEGEDTTNYGTFLTGSFQIITFGASFNTMQTIQVSGGDPEFADVTTIHDVIRKRVPTVVSPLSFATDNIFDPADPGYVESNKAYKAQAKRAFKFRFGTGAKMAFNGYPAAAGVPIGQALGVVQTKISIEAQNIPTVWAT